jgi:uncharacterized membrane protein
MIRDENNEVDTVSAGLVIIIIGLLLVQCAPILSDLSYTPREITGYEDKTTRIPDYIAPFGIIMLGFFITVIGCAIFWRNFINKFYETQILSRCEVNNNKKLIINYSNTH